MKQLILGGGVFILLVVGVATASAETVPLGSKQDTSTWPGVLISPETIERAESYVVILTAEPVEELEFTYYIRCSRRYGAETTERESSEITVMPAATITILPTLPEPEDCSMHASAWAGLETPETPVTVKIEVTGNRRPAPPLPTVEPVPAPIPPIEVHGAWRVCEKPTFLRTGRTETLGETCARARLMVATAWNRPREAGHWVKVLGFACRRSRHGRSARVDCVKGVAVVKASGLLR